MDALHRQGNEHRDATVIESKAKADRLARRNRYNRSVEESFKFHSRPMVSRNNNGLMSFKHFYEQQQRSLWNQRRKLEQLTKSVEVQDQLERIN